MSSIEDDEESGGDDDVSDRPTSMKNMPRKVVYEDEAEGNKSSRLKRHHADKLKNNSSLLQHMRGLSATGGVSSQLLDGTDVDLKMSTMEKQLDEKALKLRMLREELQIMASSSETQSQQEDIAPSHYQ